MSSNAAAWSECRAASDRVLEQVDWAALGAIYFHEDGEAHWDARLADLRRLGAKLAEELGHRLTLAGASFWCGAGVAEVPVLVAEALRLGRRLVVVNPNEEECRILNDAFAAAEPELGICYQPVDARDVPPEEFDHVGCISVFTDPETWPTLSGVAYGRLPPVQVDLEQFGAEREDARLLAEALAERLAPSAWLTTTPEEVSWFLEQAEHGGFELQADEELVETAVVGDPVGFLRRC
ncbi:MAG: hypothetical protein AB8H80_01795 [Planctomycetota bacterium]